jgi:phosphoribosylamine-glycine ligase
MLGDFLADIARAQLRQFSVREDGFGAALRVTIPPWPTEKHHAEENVPLRGLPTSDKHVYYYNVKRNEAGLASAGAWGILLLLTGFGDTPGRALAQPSKMAKELRIKNRQYRTDLVKAFEADLEKLEEFHALRQRVG